MSEKTMPESWLSKIAIDCFDQISTTNNKVKSTACSPHGLYPVIDQGQNYISGYINDESKLIKITTPICIFGDHTRIIKWVEHNFVPGADGTKLLKPKDFIYPRYAYYSLCALNIPDKGYSRHFKYFKELNIDIPAWEEQKIIAEKLDTLLAQVDSTKARLEQIPQILKRFRQAVLTYAVNGTLTSEWREINTPDEININEISDILFQNKITLGNFGKKTTRADIVTEEEMSLVVQHVDKWKLIRIGEICGCIVPNRDKPKTFSGGYHWLLTQNFAESSIWINYSQIKLGLSPEEIIKYKSRIVPKGNVIMTCVGRVGMSAVLEEDAVINQQLHAFITNDYITPEYLAYCIRANKKFFDKKATSTTINYLNKTACNSLPIPLPCFEEQHEIVRRVEQLFAYADTIEKQVNNALARVNNLTQSILAKAFRGELTAQWRAENPELISGENSAAALLEKIKAERAASGGKKASRKKN